MTIHAIDHVLVGVRDLDRALASYTRLGFRMLPRGDHHPKGTGNHVAVLGRTYIELLGVLHPEKDCLHYDELLPQREGIYVTHLKAGNVEAEVRRLRAVGVPPSDPMLLSRRMEVDGKSLLLSTTVSVYRDVPSQFAKLSMVQHHNPDVAWLDGWALHPNTALDVTSVTILAEDPSVMLQRAAALEGVPVPAVSDRTDLLGGALRIVTRRGLRAWWPHDLGDTAAWDLAMVGLDVRVGSREACRQLLRKAGVQFCEDDASLMVDPSATHGVLLRIVE